jgi:alpha-beta hydrolase superfamily lysophospholipase
MRRFVWGTATRVVRALAYGLVGGTIVAIFVLVKTLQGRPELQIWHTTHLDAEFTADSDVTTFPEYLALEDRLFAQLEDEIISQVPVGPSQITNRYSRGSLADPGRWPRNWNRSYELRNESARVGVLMLHGMSDGPYSMRGLAELLHGAGAHVVGLRLPGHGTVSSGLVHVRWQDMATASAIALRHVRSAVGDAPVYVVGYSNGAALAVNLALEALEDETLPPANGLLLLSPAIGVTPLAALAVWQSRLGTLLGLDQLAWQSLGPEYDPFKYVSFAVNAGDVTYRLTERIRTQLTAQRGRLGELPPILAFLSGVDATVSTRAVLEHLFFPIGERKGKDDHELVLFDVNRRAEVDPMLRNDPRDTFGPLLSDRTLDFTLSVVTNADEQSSRVEIHSLEPGDSEQARTPLDLEWPHDVFSLSHVALPFRPDDPVYGGRAPGAIPGFQIGSLAVRGERGVLRVSGNDMLRLRWNPFFEYLAQRALAFTDLSP